MTRNHRIRLDLAYDGTDFAGWQRQPDRDTIQQRIEGALSQLYRRPVAVVAAGRTDAGVHAEGQVAHYDASLPIPPEGVTRALNRSLPPAIRIRTAAAAPPDFHARYDAVSRTYRYHLVPGTPPSPLVSRFAWATGRALDRAAFEAEAAALPGTHDFRAFFTDSGDGRAQNPVRTVIAARVLRSGVALVFEITANAFLRYMVRRIVGTLEAVARGQLSPGRIAELLRDPGRAGPRFRAPAAGLRLHAVGYPPDLAG